MDQKFRVLAPKSPEGHHLPHIPPIQRNKATVMRKS
uniref:Uncharacterized protein n=1 Tax=Arundo donax TaxID=35708 RepID=A0A0A8ZXS3_ARUDO